MPCLTGQSEWRDENRRVRDQSGSLAVASELDKMHNRDNRAAANDSDVRGAANVLVLVQADEDGCQAI